MGQLLKETYFTQSVELGLFSPIFTGTVKIGKKTASINEKRPEWNPIEDAYKDFSSVAASCNNTLGKLGYTASNISNDVCGKCNEEERVGPID